MTKKKVEKGISERIDINFKREVEDISIQRVKSGLDKEPKDVKSIREITRAIARASKFPKLKKDIIEGEFDNDML